MNKTEISWTDLTWNQVFGCSKKSPGCQNCYAEYLTVHRFHRSFEVRLRPEKLKEVKKIPAGSKVFVNSMSDMFHEKVPYNFIDQTMDAIASRPDVIFQILTKRPENAEKYYTASKRFIPFPENLWLGVSVELPLYEPRIGILRYLPVQTRFISFEPLLADIGKVDLSDIDWIIIGGESGPNHRPMKIDWARSLVKQAKEQNVAIWMKQLGGFRPGTKLEDLPEDLRIREFPGVKP